MTVVSHVQRPALVEARRAPRAQSNFRPSRDLYPFESRWFDAPGGRLHYVDEGSGHPLLLVHGNPTWSFLYRKVIRNLTRRGFRCIAPDLLGYGLSEHPCEEHLAPSAQSDAVLALVRALRLGRVIVMGQDWGGPIGLAAAVQMPEALAGLVLGSSFAWRTNGITRCIGHVLATPGVQSWMVRSDRFIDRVVSGLTNAPLTTEELDHYRLVAATPELRRAKIVLPRQLTAADAWLGCLENDVRQRLAQTRALLFEPEREGRLGRASVERFARMLPAHRVVPLTGAGHFFQEDAPNAVAEAIAERFG